MGTAGRDDRLSGPSSPNGRDGRDPSHKDRDRILYTSAFRRLAGVTQVVGAVEGHVFHNRLTHTLEVAQLARRLAERLARDYKTQLSAAGTVIDPEVAEAAALAHDLGHPPFGHVAEAELNALVSPANADGYEGNPQSFRILTRLATQRAPKRGLDLTRATLNAVLKYPWTRHDGPPDKPDKFGAYRTERECFDFARVGYGKWEKSLEAAIMDHADGVAYSVHDLDDFYRAGIISLADVTDAFDRHLDNFRQGKKLSDAVIDAHLPKLKNLFGGVPRGRYTGEYTQRAALRAMSSNWIENFVSEVTLDFSGERPQLVVPEGRYVEMKFLQSIVWNQVIMSPRLATQQHGQRHIIRYLYNAYKEALSDRNEARRLLPGAFLIELQHLDDSPEDGAPSKEARIARLAADVVASFTDSQAVAVFRRMSGAASGSITDLIEG